MENTICGLISNLVGVDHAKLYTPRALFGRFDHFIRVWKKHPDDFPPIDTNEALHEGQGTNGLRPLPERFESPAAYFAGDLKGSKEKMTPSFLGGMFCEIGLERDWKTGKIGQIEDEIWHVAGFQLLLLCWWLVLLGSRQWYKWTLEHSLYEWSILMGSRCFRSCWRQICRWFQTYWDTIGMHGFAYYLIVVGNIPHIIWRCPITQHWNLLVGPPKFWSLTKAIFLIVVGSTNPSQSGPNISRIWDLV